MKKREHVLVKLIIGVFGAYILLSLYKLKGEVGNGTIGIIALLVCAVAFLAYELFSFQYRYYKYRENLKRVIIDLWQHTERYDNGFIRREEARSNRRLSLFDRMKLFIKNNGEEDVMCELLYDNESLKSKYRFMDKTELKQTISEMEAEMDEINAKARSKAREACFGGSECDDVDPESVHKEMERIEYLSKHYPLALKEYVNPDKL